MKTRFRFLALFMVPALAIGLSTFLVACGGDADGDGDGDGDTTPAVFTSATPASGGTIPADSTVTLVFDKDPGTLKASVGTVGGAGANRTVVVPGEDGDVVSVVLSWDNDGTTTLTYTLTKADTTAPTLSSSTPGDGDAGVDPEAINADGIVLEFSETIVKTALEVQSGGAKVGNWTATKDGSTITMEPSAGAELVNETEYEVVGSVEDAAGNETDVSVTFTTKAKDD
jgi:hypothetical protein